MHSHCMGIPFYKKKISGDIFFSKTRQSVRSTKRVSVRFFFFSFYHFRVQKMGEREMTTAGPPAPSGEQQHGTKRILSTASSFFSVQRSSHWSCRSSQSCASRSRRRNVSSAISQTTTRKKNFFRHSSRSLLQLPKQCPKQRPFQKEEKRKRKLLFPAHVSQSHSGFRSAVFFSPFFISLLSNCSLTFAADIC